MPLGGGVAGSSAGMKSQPKPDHGETGRRGDVKKVELERKPPQYRKFASAQGTTQVFSRTMRLPATMIEHPSSVVSVLLFPSSISVVLTI